MVDDPTQEVKVIRDFSRIAQDTDGRNEAIAAVRRAGKLGRQTGMDITDPTVVKMLGLDKAIKTLDE